MPPAPVERPSERRRPFGYKIIYHDLGEGRIQDGLRREVDLQTFREVTKEMDAALDQLDREHKSLTSEAAMPELPDPSLAWEDLSAVDRRALTEMLVDKIIIERHPSKIDEDGRRHYTIRAIPYQDPQQEAERLNAVHEARVKIVPRV